MTQQPTSRPLIIPKDAEPGWTWLLSHGGVKLTLGDDRQLRDASGTIYAAMDERLMSDNDPRAGASGVYFHEEHVLSKAAPPHEFQTSSTTYQKYHSGEEAIDDYLKNVRLLSRPGSWVDRVWQRVAEFALRRLRVQDPYWDNKTTLRKKGPLP